MAKTTYIVRNGRGTAKARRVLTQAEGYQVGGFRNEIWYTGTLNVDIEDSKKLKPILNVVDDSVSGTLSVAYDQEWGASDPTLGYPHRHFVRFFSIRSEMEKIFADPSRYLLIINGLELNQYSVSTWQIVWRAQYGDTPSDEYYVSLTKGSNGPTSFNVEIRALATAPITQVIFSVVDTKINKKRLYASIRFIRGSFVGYAAQWLTSWRAGGMNRGDLDAFFAATKDRVMIESAYGFQAKTTWDMATYSGTSVKRFAGEVMLLAQVSEKFIDDIMAIQ